MSTKVDEKGEITLPKEILEAAGIHAGDNVILRPRLDGGLVVEKAGSDASSDAYRGVLEDMAQRKPFKGFTTDELMAFTRGED